MIPYPHDTTESVDGTDPVTEPFPDPVIEPSAFLDGRRFAPRRGFIFGAFLVALCLHGYALAVLPDAMEINFAEANDADANLMNDEIGNDPDLPTNYNVDRLEEVSVPEPLNNLAPDSPAGMGNAPIGDPADSDGAARLLR
jgi:hypothetical protein